MRLSGSMRRPLWLAAAVGEAVLELALGVVREMRFALEQVVVHEVKPSERGAPVRAARERAARERSARERAGRASTASSPRTAPDVPAPVSAPPRTAADVIVEEPWEGYDGMNVRAVRDRLGDADRELLAAVVLYEGFSKKRSSVIGPAERRLTRLSSPRS